MTRPPADPPRLARALAEACLRGDAAEVIVGDLDEEFSDAVASGRPLGAARRRYWRQTLASILAINMKRQDTVTTRTGFHPFRGFNLDVRSVTRALRQSPGYALVAVLSLAIGIGANTAIFSLVRQFLLQPLLVDRPDELRVLYWALKPGQQPKFMQLAAGGYRTPDGGFYRSNVSYPEYCALRDALAGTADAAAFNFMPQMTLGMSGRGPAVASGMIVSGNFFSTLRPPIAAGRALNADDDKPGAPAAAVIGHELWLRYFGGDPRVVGQVLQVNGVPVTIAGITGAGYRGLSPGGFSPPADITVALAQQPSIAADWSDARQSLFTSTNTNWIRVLVRVEASRDARAGDIVTASLKNTLAGGGLTADQAATITPRLFPAYRGLDTMRTATTQPLRILGVVVGVVLFIACINVAGLMLARGVARQRELAVRRALGAGRARIVRELLLESVLLSVAGGIAGLLLALWTAPAVGAMLTSSFGTSGVSVALDWPLFGITMLLACAAGILAGLLPAIRFSRGDAAMLNQRPGGSGAPRLMVGRLLLALQMAVSLPLVAGAGLFLRTLHNLGSIDLGFNPEGLALFTVDPTKNGTSPERAQMFFPALLDRLESIPSVTSATVLENLLISGTESDSTVTVDGQKGDMYLNSISPHFFETMGVRLIGGRGITAADTASSPRVAVVNETAARMFFPGASPIGRRIHLGQRDYELVGIVADSKYDGLKNKVEPTMLLSYLQRGNGSLHVAVRSGIDPASLRKPIEQAVQQLDPTLPITNFKTQTDQIDETIGRERVFARLLTVFGGFALLLACIGLHGVTSYSVARRTGEIGIRLALGAQRAQVLWLVLRQVVTLTAIGLLLGLPLAWLAGPTVQAFLFGLTPGDPITILAAAAVMSAVAIAAGLLPARRAAHMQVVAALRSE